MNMKYKKYYTWKEIDDLVEKWHNRFGTPESLWSLMDIYYLSPDKLPKEVVEIIDVIKNIEIR